MATLALPSIAVPVGQTVVSPSLAVPLGLQWARVELDGAAWAAGTRIAAVVDLSPNGGANWTRIAGIETGKADLIGNKCGTGVLLTGPNANPQLMVRANIPVLAGSDITLAGSLIVDNGPVI